MMRHLLALYLCVSLTLSTFAQQSATATVAADSGARLPVKRVVLYKNGVGYFEHTARVRGSQELNIDFTTAQLNDVLKSLTVVDLGEGRISSVRYNSIAPLDERLKALRLPFTERITRADYLAALRGTRVEVRSGTATAVGRLLSVESEQRVNDKTTYMATIFSVVTDSGEMRNFELGSNTSVRIAERDLSDEVGRYMNLVGSSRARDLRRMTISDTGSGERNVFVSYISEVPVWKSTYRIILSEKENEKPLLQGWAIVDNTVGEDWKDVQLSLIAGAPQSFIQQISQPYYVRRPVVELPQSMTLTPQAHEGTVTDFVVNGNVQADMPPPPPPTAQAGPVNVPLNGRSFVQMAQLMPGVAGGGGGVAGVVNDPSGATVTGAQVSILNRSTNASQVTSTDSRGAYQFSNLAPGSYSLTFSYSGFKTTQTRLRVEAGRIHPFNATLSVANTAETVEVDEDEESVTEAAGKQHVEAEGKDLGDYFEYNIKQPITVGKNQSALVPVLMAHIDAEKVTIWNEESSEIRRALWMTNSSGLTLDSGTFNILDGKTFAGEGLLDAVQPAERRLISYAADPALRVTMDRDGVAKPATHVRIAKGIMILTREIRDTRKYTLHNSDTQAHVVVIEHPSRDGWKLVEGTKPEETTASYLRFRVPVAAGKTENFNIEEYHPEDSHYELSELDSDQVKLISQQPLTPAVRDAIRRVLIQKNEVSNLENQMRLRRAELSSINADQNRLRENMKALKGSAEEKALLQRYTKQLDAQEDRLAALNKEISDLEDKTSKARQQLDEMIQQITMDENLS